MECLFHHCNIYSFSADSNRLACLVHVINLTITSVLSAVTKISNVDTTTNIWEFDPTLPQNRMLNDSLDVITTIRTLAIKMQCSGQQIEYFETLQVKCGINPPLSIPLHSNVRWGTADGMLSRAHELHQPINMFINSADELYGPITTVRNNGRAKRIPWTNFTLLTRDWERVHDTRSVISDANNIQQLFLDEDRATLWHVIPEIEELLTAWEKKQCLPKYSAFRNALWNGINKIMKYYNRFDDKRVYVLALVLHPYFKLDYIKMAWGGAEEQAKEIAEGNQNAKNWHDKVLQVVESTMQEYWQDMEDARTVQGTTDARTPLLKDDTLESEYDRHRRTLIEKAGHGAALGWAVELCCYLADIPENTTKNMDIINW
ncbi:hypothetical protein V8E55_008920 [Tylopilus felleus]